MKCLWLPCRAQTDLLYHICKNSIFLFATPLAETCCSLSPPGRHRKKGTSSTIYAKIRSLRIFDRHHLFPLLHSWRSWHLGGLGAFPFPGCGLARARQSAANPFLYSLCDSAFSAQMKITDRAETAERQRAQRGNGGAKLLLLAGRARAGFAAGVHANFKQFLRAPLTWQ